MNTPIPVSVVIFRTWKSTNSVIALFPYDTFGNGTCTSYEHVGQHGGANYSGVMEATRPATPEEYADLKTELESIGYNLRVIEKRGLK